MGTWIFLLNGEGGQNPGMFDNIWGTALLIGAIVLVFYFLMVRPQKKERARMKSMLESLRKNDEVVTAGGVHGRVAAIKDDVIILKIDENSDVKLRVSRTSIIGVVKREDEKEEEEKKD